MAGFNRIPTQQPQQYDNDISPFAGAHTGQARSLNPASAVTDRIMRGVLGYMDQHSQRTLDKLDYAYSLDARRRGGEDISWRSPRFGPASQPQSMDDNHGSPYRRDTYDQRPPSPPPRPQPQQFSRENEGDPRFAPDLPPRRQEMRTQHDDLHAPQEDLRSEYGMHTPLQDEHQERQQALAQHLEGLPEMIHGMLSEFMQGMQLQVAALAQRVEQLERGQAVQAPPLPPRPISQALQEESPAQPPRPGQNHPAMQSRIKRRPVGGHPPALPPRAAAQQSLDAAESLTAPASREEDRAQSEPLAPVPRREFPPPPLHPDAALRRRERETQMRRMSISTDAATETESGRTDAEQYVDNDDSRTHDQNYRTRPLVDEPVSSGSAAPGLAAGVGDGGRNQTDADAAKATLANLKAYTNLTHESLDFTERLTR